MQPLIVVIPEISAAGRLKPVAFELAACARRLKALVGGEVKAVVPAEDPSGPAAAMAAPGGCAAVAVSVPGLTAYNGDVTRRVLAGVLAGLAPRYVLVAHTSQGLDFGPALAGATGAACITAVEALELENGAPVFVRPVHGGKFCAHLASEAATTLLTIQPGAFRPDPDPADGPFAVETLSVTPPAAARSRTTAVVPAPAAAGEIAEAEVVVAAGRGLGGRENLDLVFRLAAQFPKSAVAGSRIACDLGWLEHRRQVGVTGATVSPRLYIACGISGAIQHVMGMRGAGFVVAVNKDPAAAIFREADVCVVEDLAEFIPVLVAAAESSRREAES
jgi:electron transfer flavoprotein alpha subunit